MRVEVVKEMRDVVEGSRQGGRCLCRGGGWGVRGIASCSIIVVDSVLAQFSNQALAGRWTRSSGSVAQAESGAGDVMSASTTFGA